MRVLTILDHIDSGHMALPEFQRGYVWNRDQVRGLFDSLYRRHPVGGLLVWATESRTATHRGDGVLAPGIVKLLLDGQQRMTSLYGVVRGKPPKSFDANAQASTGLRFHLASQTFAFYQPVKMQDEPLLDRRHRTNEEGHQRTAFGGRHTWHSGDAIPISPLPRHSGDAIPISPLPRRSRAGSLPSNRVVAELDSPKR
jgi:hypothetical protein